ncbi:conserved hypothetical protein [Ricinus communis]|uniref:Uncharacterized protein n=1 Tax=Ricinus communis TaxID=3988 RepID=B9SFU1_RICCO|nr:conserved hypothetical protein [Ricinus communis]
MELVSSAYKFMFYMKVRVLMDLKQSRPTGFWNDRRKLPVGRIGHMIKFCPFQDEEGFQNILAIGKFEYSVKLRNTNTSGFARNLLISSKPSKDSQGDRMQTSSNSYPKPMMCNR